MAGVREMFTENEAARGGDQQRCGAAHQRIDETDVAGPVGRGNELEVGELEDGRRQDERPGIRMGQGHEGKEGETHHAAAERDHRCIERLVRAGFDEGIPGRMQGRAEQHEKENV
jgi:hypothetical protein